MTLDAGYLFAFLLGMIAAFLILSLVNWSAVRRNERKIIRRDRATARVDPTKR
jgi:hypothetical protein